MPAEQLKLLEELYRAWGVGTPLSEVQPFLHPEFEWVNPDYAVEPGTRHGPEGWLAMLFDELHGVRHCLSAVRDVSAIAIKNAQISKTAEIIADYDIGRLLRRRY